MGGDSVKLHPTKVESSCVYNADDSKFQKAGEARQCPVAGRGPEQGSTPNPKSTQLHLKASALRIKELINQNTKGRVWHVVHTP